MFDLLSSRPQVSTGRHPLKYRICFGTWLNIWEQRPPSLPLPSMDFPYLEKKNPQKHDVFSFNVTFYVTWNHSWQGLIHS